MIIGGAAAAALVVALDAWDTDDQAGPKAIFLLGIGGIGVGVGLVQLAWPPRPAAPGDARNAFERAPWPQKVLWVIGGFAGIVAVAIAQATVNL